MNARDLPPLPWTVGHIIENDLDWCRVVGADGRIVFDDLTREAAEIFARPDVAALLRGEAVAVPKEPTDDMVVAGDEANPTIWEDGTSGEYCVRVVETIYRAMLAASPFAEEGKE